ncbi:oligosaccharide flippase family protein [Reichenbachiella sp.]|uniref:oligosaccharide flippase family protein n=1 Tax=Reichenbachiella sp. TaxID=2184521 RepID=UPI003BAF938B
MSRKKALINGTLINGLSTVYVALLTFLLIPIFIENLGVTGYGLIGIANIFSLLGYISFFDFGMASTVPKFIAEYRSKKQIDNLNELINTSLLLFIIIGVILAILIVPFLEYIIEELFSVPPEFFRSFVKVVTVLVVSYIFQFPLLILKGILQGFLRFDILQWALILVETLRFGVVYYLVTNNYGFEVVVYSNIIAPFILTTIYLVAIVKIFPEYNFRSFSILSIKKIRKFSSFQFIGKFSSLLYNNTDRFLIGVFLSPAVMGAYDVLTKIPMMINKFFGLAVSAIIPITSSLDQKTEENLIKGLYHRGFRFYFAFVCPIICASLFFSNEFILLWVGPEFLNLYHSLLLMIMWNLATTFLFGGNILIGLNRGMFELTAFRIGIALVKIISCYLLIKEFNISAIPYSYLLSSLLIFYILNVFKRKIGFDSKKFILDVFLIIISGIVPLIINSYILSKFSLSQNLFQLGLEVMLWCTIQWVIIYLIAFDSEDKKTITSLLKINA